MEEPKSGRPAGRVTVVGVGASAGGIDALRELFSLLPADLGLAYVVIVHLAPHHESDLAAILARHTAMRVVQVSADGMDLEPNCVYVIPPDCRLEIDDERLAAKPFDEPRGPRAPIDLFLRSLAAHGDGFAVILSGGNSDGTIGAKAVKEAGGLVLVQDPKEAAHDTMPRAVINAELADVVMPVRELAFCLTELWRQRQQLDPLLRPALMDRQIGENDEAALMRIFDLIRARTGHDFSRYKRNTILRRLARRMQLNRQTDLQRYTKFLTENPHEVQSLFDDFLISVTTFFRDPEAWEALRTNAVVPLVERARRGGDPIRVWVPACATGEEAYTIAMLFREEIGGDEHCDVVVFASDVDENALAVAREGLYPASIAADLSEARLQRFFRRENDHYRVTSELRDMIVFASHNMLRDPPFSKLDLVSCRNLLIYLDRELQQQVQQIFRYALREGGYLFIGVSESADLELFDPVEKQHRVFRARKSGPGPVRLPQASVSPNIPEAMERAKDRDLRSRHTAADIHVGALEAFAPPSVLVDERWDVVHLSESVGRFLQPRGGPPSRALMELVRPELADELRMTLHETFDGGDKRLSRFVPVRFNGTPRLVAVLVQPRVGGTFADRHALVTFLEAGEAPSVEPVAQQESTDQTAVLLKEKLRVAEQRLETMRQEHTTAYEDLRAANEELQSLNEEYRSTTEELETSKEELQSVNEELQTVNQELKMKLEEVSRAKSDLENFMTATDIPILFLDRRLAIKRYTPPLAQIFNVKPHDQGRPIGDLTHTLDYPELAQDALRVLGDLVPIERSVKSRDGKELLVRIRPYRTAEDKIDGVVVTFVTH